MKKYQYRYRQVSAIIGIGGIGISIDQLFGIGIGIGQILGIVPSLIMLHFNPKNAKSHWCDT